MVDYMLWVVVGVLTGWLVGIITQADAARGMQSRMVVGVVGAFLGGLSFKNLLGLIGSASSTSVVQLSSLLIAFVGAIILSEVVNLMQRPGPVAHVGVVEED